VSPAYRTPGGVIPAPLFWFFWETLPALEAQELLRAARAAHYGDSLANAGKEPAVKSYGRRIRREAFPVIRTRTPEG